MSRQSTAVPVSAVTTWLSGGTPDRANAAYWAGSIPWISAATLKKARIYDSDQRITESAVRAGSKLAPQGATLVLVRGMALHRGVRAGLAMRPVSFNQDVKALIPRPGLVPQYLTYSLHAQRTRILELVSSAGSGTGVLDTSLLKRLPIWLPDSHEQKRIVQAIDDAESAVESLERLITKKLAIKQGMMQQLLTGKIRLPGFTEPWKRVSVGDIASISRGASPRPIASPRWFSDSSSVGWVRIADLSRSDGLALVSTTQRLSDDGIARSRFLPAGTLIMSIAATVGIPIITGIDTCIHDGFVAIERLRRVDQTYLLYVLKSLEGELRSAGQTGSQANVNTDIVRNLPIWVPNETEQMQIGAVLRDADMELRSLRLRLRKAEAIKQGMLQELLSGRTRLPVTEAAS